MENKVNISKQSIAESTSENTYIGRLVSSNDLRGLPGKKVDIFLDGELHFTAIVEVPVLPKVSDADDGVLYLTPDNNLHYVSGNQWRTVGSSGTDNYNDLRNKPKINGVELSGNKSSADLKLDRLTSTLTAGVTVGGVTAGTTFAAGTTYEQVFQAIFTAAPIVYHTVSFNSDGGTNVPSQQVADGQTATQPANPTKSGFTFNGWVNEATGTVFNFSTPITADITLKATWTAVIVYHTVSFDSDGGSTVAQQTVQDGQTATKPANPTKAGFDFDKWVDITAPTVEFNFSTPITRDVNLKALWTAQTVYHTVSFNTDGGTPVASQTVQDGMTASRPTTDPTKTGYTFDDWYTDGSFTTKFNFSTPITADTIVYAKFDLVPVGNPDIYIGFFAYNEGSTFADFTAKTHDQMMAGVKSQGYLADSPFLTTTVWGNNPGETRNHIYYVMIRQGMEPQRSDLTSGGITSTDYEAQIKDPTNWRAVHDDMTINGETYKVYGFRTKFNIDDTVNFYIRSA